MRAPKVSVVIPTSNAGPRFEALLKMLSAQRTGFDYEVVVIDSGSTDETAGLARRYGASVYRIAAEEFDHGATRDLGISLSRGEYAAFVVQDAVPLDEIWLSAMVENLDRDEGVAGVYGRQVPHPGSSPLSRALVNGLPTASLERREQFAGVPELYRALPAAQRRSLATFDNVSSCVRRPVWEEFRFGRSGFGEDVRWGRRIIEAGYRIVYEPRSAVFHSHERGPLYDLRRHYADQRVLADLFGRDLAPGAAALPLNALRTWASLYLRMRREAKARGVAPRLALLAARHAALSQAGAYLGGRGLRRGGRLDRFLSRGV